MGMVKSHPSHCKEQTSRRRRDPSAGYLLLHDEPEEEKNRPKQQVMPPWPPQLPTRPLQLLAQAKRSPPSF